MEQRPQRALIYVISLLVLGAVVYPCWWPWGVDSFPLSNYPMFALPRQSNVSVPTVVGVDAQGVRRPLTPELIGGARWPNMAARLVRDSVRRGRKATATLCRDIAARVTTPDVVSLEVVTETFDSIAYFTDGPKPRKRSVHARCTIERDS